MPQERSWPWSAAATSRPKHSRSTLLRNKRLRAFACIFKGRDDAIELQLIDRAKNVTHPGSRLDAQFNQMSSEQDGRGRLVLHAERARALDEPVHRRAIELAATPVAVRPREPHQQLEVHLL